MKTNTITTTVKEAGKAAVQVTKINSVPEILTSIVTNRTTVQEAGKEATISTTVKTRREGV